MGITPALSLLQITAIFPFFSLMDILISEPAPFRLDWSAPAGTKSGDG